MTYTQVLNINENVNQKKNYIKNLKVLEIRAKNIKIPAQITTYWCRIIKLKPNLINTKHHIVEVIN